MQESGRPQDKVALLRQVLQPRRRSSSALPGDGVHHPLRPAGHTGRRAAPRGGKGPHSPPGPLGADLPELL